MISGSAACRIANSRNDTGQTDIYLGRKGKAQPLCSVHCLHQSQSSSLMPTDFPKWNVIFGSN